MKFFLLFLVVLVLLSCKEESNRISKPKDYNDVTVEYSEKATNLVDRIKTIVKSFVDSSGRDTIQGKVFIDRYGINESFVVITEECDSLTNTIYSQPFLVLKYKNSSFDVFTGAEPLFFQNNFDKTGDYQLQSSRLEVYVDSAERVQYWSSIANPFLIYPKIVYTGDKKENLNR
ncbi:MAG: hypothetical protein IPK11_06915 [Ignavibacteria bacterium]|nr:hypothetical protein [Ignavibacteria bacterium]HRI30791.1 hypothetical protein [Candidatus Kapabacteria bacterium]